MKQSFSQQHYLAFKKYFQIQENPGEWDIKYMNKTKKYLPLIAWIPGIKMVGVGNSIAMNSACEESDIDLYIVCEENHIWLVRICVTFIFQIFGVRKTAKKHAGRFCLSFFSTLSGMDFSSFALKNDIYLYFWIVFFKPVLDYNDTYETFIQKNTSWADFNTYKNMIEANKKSIFLSKTVSVHPFVPWVCEKINIFFKKCFLPKTLAHAKMLKNPFGIIINDSLLKFHDNDIREKIRKKFDF